MKSNVGRSLALWLVLIVLAVMVVQMLGMGTKNRREINFSEFIRHVEAGEIADVTFKADNIITGSFKQGVAGAEKSYFEAVGDTGAETFKILKAHDIVPNYERTDRSNFISQFLFSWLPLIIFVGFFLYFIRQMQAGGGRAMSFGKSRAKLIAGGQTKVTFKDVAGVNEAKEELTEIIDFLKDPKKFTRLGGRIPKGVLLMGPPGTGKTLLARAIAGEAGVPFFSISGSDFVEMFVGVGASRVRDLFEQGKKHAPCIIFIDEIDAVGRHRGAGLGGGHDEREQTLNQLLVEMDGFESNTGVILIAATNRPDVLDPAILRPGRFDRRVVVSKPDVKGREDILKVHTSKVPLAPAVDLGTIAKGTPGMSGADLENLVNEAALIAARKNLKAVHLLELEEAKDKVLMGVERKSLVISDFEKRATAVHEAGHALVGWMIPGLDPIHKVTIIPRGMALGVTMTLPLEDRLNITKAKAENMIAFMMGGRVAEEIVLNQQTTGAGNDIERATELARKMVCEWGMSDRMGPLTYGSREEQVFLGRDFNVRKEYSEATAIAIDEEVRRLILSGHDRAKKIVFENIDKLHALTKALLEYESIDSAEVDSIFRGEILRRPPRNTSGGGDSGGGEVAGASKNETIIPTGNPILTPG